MFWHGRAWWYPSKPKHEVRFEWGFGKHATAFGFGIEFGQGDGDDGVVIHAQIPWLFSLFLCIDGIKRCKPCEIGIRIHDNTIYVKTLSYTEQWTSTDSWWRKGLSWSFPWDYRHHTTEILEHKTNYPGHAEAVFVEGRGQGGVGDGSFQRRQAAEKTVQETYDYTYKLKSGEVQHRKATVHVDRMTWRMRWWPLLPFKKVRTSICISFDQEVGEGSGGWKGGCTGCGYEMLYGETPWECLQRMEKERVFKR